MVGDRLRQKLDRVPNQALARQPLGVLAGAHRVPVRSLQEGLGGAEEGQRRELYHRPLGVVQELRQGRRRP